MVVEGRKRSMRVQRVRRWNWGARIRTELRCVRRGTAFSPMGTAGTDHPLASARAQTHKTEDVHVELSGRSGW